MLAPGQLALPAPSAPARGPKGGKGGKNQRKRSKGQGTVGSQYKNFEYLMKLPFEFRVKFHERFHKKEICFNFQKKSCSHGNCKWAHICVGCGGSEALRRVPVSLWQGSLNRYIFESVLRKTMVDGPTLSGSSVSPMVTPKILYYTCALARVGVKFRG